MLSPYKARNVDGNVVYTKYDFNPYPLSVNLPFAFQCQQVKRMISGTDESVILGIFFKNVKFFRILVSLQHTVGKLLTC